MNSSIIRFVLRWGVCSLGLWISAGLLGDRINYQNRLSVVLVAGLVLAIINMVIKPLVVILSLPALLFSLGLFMIVINGFMVLLVSKIYGSLEVANFWSAALAGMIIGLVNYLVTAIVEEK
jgi:putative membrane protein